MAQLLGHSSAMVTLQVYAHVFAAGDAALAAAMDKRIGKARRTSEAPAAFSPPSLLPAALPAAAESA
jgi:hypothetical protein